MSTKYGFYAQYGEDVILARIFAGRAKGVAVEVGAFDGVNASNSYHFERKGWDCVLVEPNPDLAGLIRQSRPRAQLFECAVGRKYGKMVLQIPEGDETLASLNSNADELRRVASKKTGNRRAADAPEQPIKDIEVAVMPLDDILEKPK